MRNITNPNETSFLGNGIWWYRDGLGHGYPGSLTLEPQANDLQLNDMCLDVVVTASRRAQRQYKTMRDRLETISGKWSGIVRHVVDGRWGGVILAQVLIEMSGTAVAALVTSNEDGVPTSHISVAVPAGNIASPVELPVIAMQSLTASQVRAIRSRLVDNVRAKASVAFTVATGPRDLEKSYADTTYSLDALLVREMLVWMRRHHQHANQATVTGSALLDPTCLDVFSPLEDY
jgi:hypothetical protein